MKREFIDCVQAWTANLFSVLFHQLDPYPAKHSRVISRLGRINLALAILLFVSTAWLSTVAVAQNNPQIQTIELDGTAQYIHSESDVNNGASNPVTGPVHIVLAFDPALAAAYPGGNVAGSGASTNPVGNPISVVSITFNGEDITSHLIAPAPGDYVKSYGGFDYQEASKLDGTPISFNEVAFADGYYSNPAFPSSAQTQPDGTSVVYNGFAQHILNIGTGIFAVQNSQLKTGLPPPPGGAGGITISCDLSFPVMDSQGNETFGTTSDSLIVTITAPLFKRLTGIDQVDNPRAKDNNLDDPVRPKPDASVLHSIPSFSGGLIADGVTPWIISVSGPPRSKFSVNFDDPVGGKLHNDSLSKRLYILTGGAWENATSGTTSDTGEGYAYVSGIPAEDLEFDTPSIEVNVTAHITLPNGQSKGSFAIRKPFLVLIHGILSDGKTWYNPDPDLTPSPLLKLLSQERYFTQNDPRNPVDPSFIQTITYSSILGCTFKRFADLARINLDPVLLDLEDHEGGPFAKWAFTRYDVVGHSQGGVLARMLCQNNLTGSAAFSVFPVVNPQNMNRGRFRRVITIGSPHNGTILAPFLRYSVIPSLLGGQFLQALPDFLTCIAAPGGKFDPFGEQIAEINSDLTPVDPRVRFRCIRTAIFGGNKIVPDPKLPRAYSLIGLNSRVLPVSGSDSVTRGEVVLPRGSDGIVDFDSQIGGGTKNSTLFKQPFVPLADLPLNRLSLGDSSHANRATFFNVGIEAFDTNSPLVGIELVSILDAPLSEFGPFVLPSKPNPDLKKTILSVALLTVVGDFYQETSSDQIRVNSGGAVQRQPSPNPSEVAASSQYSFHFQALPNKPLIGKPSIFAEVLGPNGVSTTGVTAQASGVDQNDVIITVDASVQGDVVLYSSYTSTDGTLVFGTTLLVASIPAGTTVTGITVDPASSSMSVGDSLPLAVWEIFDNTVKSRFLPSAEEAPQFSSSDMTVATVDSQGVVSALSPGSVNITVTYNGFITQSVISVTRVQVHSFAGYSGKYSGVISTSPAIVDGAGAITVSLADSGVFSAGIVFGGRRYALKGILGAEGSFTGFVPKSVPAVNVSFQIPLGMHAGQMTGSVSQGQVIAQILCELNPFNSKHYPCPQAGIYTFQVSPLTNAPSVPQGIGFGTATVNASGLLTFKGSLSDGTSFSEGGFVAGSGGWSFCSAPYNNKGLLSGRIVFESSPGASDANGTLLWSAPRVKSGPYAAGFVTAANVVGSVYQRPAKGVRIISFADSVGNGEFTAEGGGLPQSFMKQITLSISNAIAPGIVAADKLQISVALAGGTITGSFVPAATAKPVKFRGAVLQILNNGMGYFINQGQSGDFKLTAK